MSIRIFQEHKQGEVWTWQEIIAYTLLLVFTFGFAFSEYRNELAKEFRWSILSGWWVFFGVNILFFIPMLVFSPITIPTYIVCLHWRQKTDAKNLMINTLREK